MIADSSPACTLDEWAYRNEVSPTSFADNVASLTDDYQADHTVYVLLCFESILAFRHTSKQKAADVYSEITLTPILKRLVVTTCRVFLIRRRFVH